MTAAGTIAPAKVMVFGAGVAGLQAIATAKRLGAIVSATDVRMAAKEQVESLGGKFVMVEDDETRVSSSSTITNLPPKLSTCSFAAILTSVAETIAPSLFAVAIACKPATPAPNTITFAGAIVPAAVIIIGIALLNK